MAQYEEQNPLDYRPGGDTIDDFAQKYMKEINRVYQFLNNIREHNSNGTYQVEPQPYIFKVTDNKLYIRNGANNAWLYLFDITYRMGMSDNPDAVILTSDDVTSTAEALKLVKTNSDGDIDANITGNAYKFGNKTADQYITVDDVSDAGAALKIVKTDSNGVAQISISGSAVKLNGKAANYYLNQDDVTTSGEANKIVKTDANGKIAADITGNALKFGNKTADNYLTTDDVATVEAGTITSTPNKLVKTNANGLLPVNISGNAGQIAGKNAEINNLQDGQVLTYRLASNTWRNEDKGVVGSGRALALYDGSILLAEYDGDAPISIDLAKHNRIASTAYTVSTFANHDTLPAGWFLECTTAGTSSSNALTITSPTVGGTVNDGTVVWTIRKSASTQDLTNYLPLSGGIMSGAIKGTNQNLSLYAQSDISTGARLLLEDVTFGGVNSVTSGMFFLSARDAANGKFAELKGYSNGDLQWGPYSGVGNYSDLGGSAIVAKSITANGYIQYASRLLIQWGVVVIPKTAPYECEVVYPITYNEPARVTLTSFLQNATMQQVAIKDQTAKYNKFTVQATGYCYVYWQAIGYK